MENLTENKYLRRELHSQTLNNYYFKPGNILRWRDRSVFSNIVKLNCRDRDIEWSQSWCLGGFWEGEVRAEMNDLSVRPRLAAVWMFDAKGYSGETGADMRWIWLRLASPSHYSPAQRGGCPPIGQTEVDISAGRGRGGGRAWFLTGIHNRAVMWHKARSEEGERPRETQHYNRYNRPVTTLWSGLVWCVSMKASLTENVFTPCPFVSISLNGVNTGECDHLKRITQI